MRGSSEWQTLRERPEEPPTRRASRPEPTEGVPPPHRLRAGSWFTWLLGCALLATVVLVARNATEARDFARLAERADPRWMVVAIALQLGTYAAQGAVLSAVAKAGRVALRLRAACRVSVVKLFVDQAIPSAGLSGTAVLAKALERRGIPRPVVAAGVVVELASYYFAFVACLAAALVISAASEVASALMLLVIAIFSIVAMALSVTVLALSGRPDPPEGRRRIRLRPLRRVLDFVRDADPRLARRGRLLALTSGYQIAIVLCDAATVWALLRSIGAHGSPGGVFASFMISNLFRTISVVPGGLGAFEAASVITLRMVGVPIAEALASTLLFRGLSFWLPMLPGFWLSRREMSPARDRLAASSA